MAQNPKPHFPANFVTDQRRQGVGLGETSESLSLLPWVGIPFNASGGFFNYDTVSYGPCYYTKDRHGFVHLRGLFYCSSGTVPAINTVIFSLPKGFWPERVELFHVPASFGFSRCDMKTNGEFQYVLTATGFTYSGGNFFSLAGISWHAPPQ